MRNATFILLLSDRAAISTSWSAYYEKTTNYIFPYNYNAGGQEIKSTREVRVFTLPLKLSINKRNNTPANTQRASLCGSGAVSRPSSVRPELVMMSHPRRPPLATRLSDWSAASPIWERRPRPHHHHSSRSSGTCSNHNTRDPPTPPRWK